MKGTLPETNHDIAPENWLSQTIQFWSFLGANSFKQFQGVNPIMMIPGIKTKAFFKLWSDKTWVPCTVNLNDGTFNSWKTIDAI